MRKQITLPNILYKYRSLEEKYDANGKKIDYTELMLSKGEIYFASREELNDTFEHFFLLPPDWCIVSDGELSQLRLKPEKTSDATNGNGKLVYLNSEDNTRYVMSKIAQSDYGIFSLCECKHSIPMYTHYADGFKGICIGFDWEQFNLLFAGSYPPQKNIPRKIAYLPTPPEIEGTPEEWLEVFTTKSQDFEWEKEWRIFYTRNKNLSDDEKGKLFNNARRAIREIIFGHRTPKEDISKIKELIHDVKDVKLFITKPLVGKYEIEIIPYEF